MRENTCDGIVACAWLGERWATRAARIEIADRDRGWRYDIQRAWGRIANGRFVVGTTHARACVDV